MSTTSSTDSTSAYLGVNHREVSLLDGKLTAIMFWDEPKSTASIRLEIQPGLEGAALQDVQKARECIWLTMAKELQGAAFENERAKIGRPYPSDNLKFHISPDNEGYSAWVFNPISRFTPSFEEAARRAERIYQTEQTPVGQISGILCGLGINANLANRWAETIASDVLKSASEEGSAHERREACAKRIVSLLFKEGGLAATHAHDLAHMDRRNDVDALFDQNGEYDPAMESTGPLTSRHTAKLAAERIAQRFIPLSPQEAVRQTA